MKIAFITHDFGIYGASRSLRNLILQLNKQHDVHIIVHKSYRHKQNIDNISDWFKVKKANIHEFRLFFSNCYYGKAQFSFKIKIVNFLLKVIWLYIEKRKLYGFLNKEAFDIIHLNSIVLHHVLNKKLKMIIHMREIFDGTVASVIKNLEKARGVIFIDIATKEAVKNSKITKSIILNNPFDMTVLNNFSSEEFVLGSPYEIDWKKRTIFSIIGKVEDVKGILFVINVFKQYENPNALLLIVGRSNNEYLQECKKAIGADNRIIIYGEEKEIEKIYFISDYVVRGESLACIGRTTYEALYAGLQVIVPGDIKTDTVLYFDYHIFDEKIHFYSPRNLQALLLVLNNCKEKTYNKKYLSNIEQYAKSFIDFVTS